MRETKAGLSKIFSCILLLSLFTCDFAEAQMTAAEIAAAEQTATREFLGLNWSLGIGVAYDPDTRIDKASVVNGIVRVEEESRAQPRIFLEIHLFCLDQLTDHNSCEDDNPKPLFGNGPWVGIQSSKTDVIDAFALGWMWGWRKSAIATNSLNFGLGLLLDPKVQALGDGIEENKPLPAGETAIRFKKEERVGGVLLVSFTF